jgi:hypothetical protein
VALAGFLDRVAKQQLAAAAVPERRTREHTLKLSPDLFLGNRVETDASRLFR